MKTSIKIVKRMFCLLLTVLLVFTMVPTFTLTVSAAQSPSYSIKNVYANATAIVIEAGETSGYSKIRYGSNYLSFAGSNFKTGANEYEADLSNTEIYGGYSYESSGDTIVTVNGGNIGAIYGGSYISNLTGNSSIVINGGYVGTVYGSGTSEKHLHTGNVSITINGGSVDYIYGGVSNIVGDITYNMTGGSVKHMNVALKNNASYIDGSAGVTISGGTVNGFNNYTSSSNVRTCVPTNLIVTDSAWLKNCAFYGNNKNNTIYINQENTCAFPRVVAQGSNPYILSDYCNDYLIGGTNWQIHGNIDNALQGHTLEVNEGETFTVASGVSTGAKIVNNGTVNINGTYSGEMTNNGTVKVTGVAESSTMVNYGNLILEDGSSVNKIENYGTVTTRGELNVKTLNNYATVDYTGTPGPNTYVYNAVGSKFFCHGDHDGLKVDNAHTGSNWSIFYCESTDCTSTPNGWYYGIVEANFYTSYLTITEKKGNFCWMNEFSCRFVPESDSMVLPKTIRVEENDGYKSTVLEEGKHYSYDPYTGEFVFFEHVADYAEIRIYCYAGPKTGLDISGNNSNNFTTVELEETRYLYDGTAKTPAIKSITHTSFGTETELKEGEDYTYTYKNNVEEGTGYVVITGKNWYGSTIRVPFEIYKLELKDRVYGEDYCEVTLENDSLTYDAKELEPEVSEVKYYTFNESEAKYEIVTLTEGVDYTVSYKNNVEPGEGTAIVTGIGKYKGEVSATFEIGKAPISKATVSGNVSAFDGTDQSLNVTLTHNGVVLTEGVDYELTYAEGGKMHYPGDTLTVQVWGIGDRYWSSTSFEWKIVEESLEGLEYSIFRNGESLVYTGLPQKPKKWLVRVTTTSGVDCLCYGTWSSVTNVGDSITFTSTSSIFSGTVEFTENIMSKADIATVTAYDNLSRVYTGEEQTVDLEAYLGFGDYYLEEGKDYTLEGETSATEPGEYTVTLKGMGNFKGEKTVTWRINPINIKESEVTVDKVPSFTYDGASHVLDTVLYYTYSNGTKVEIPGTWNEIRNVSDKAVFTADSESPYFYGTYEIENVVQKLDITDLAEFPETCDYTGYTQSLSPTLEDFDYFTYYLTYNESPVNVGTYTATIKGTGNFTGTVERTFQVLPAKLSVNIYLDTKYYDGTTDVEISSAHLLGVRADDDVTMDYSELEVILPSADAGVYKTAEIKGLSITGEDSGNYTFDASEGVALKGYYGGDFRISTRQLIINAEDQKLDSGETPDQSMWYCDSVPDGFTVSDIVLTADEEELRIVPSGGVVTEDSTGRDVTHNFWFDYSWAYLTLNCTNHTPDDNGFCSNCGGYEAAKLNDNGTPEEEWDDYYEISNAGQLYWYAEQVNAYYSSVSAVLVDDIVVNEDLTAENLREWTPIGSGSHAFVADFDGQGHTVSGLYCKADHDYVGFFGYTDYNYPISNLGIKDSYFEGNNYVGAFAGYGSSAISNCFVENVEVVCNGYNGADFAGYNGGYIENCYSASDSFVDYNYGTITNCYYLADEETNNEDGLTFKTAEQFKSGEVAYLLQSGIAEEDIYDDEWNYIETIIPEIWGQKIGEDNYPVLGGDKVYYVTNCKDENIYSNKNENGQHNFVDGECTICGKVCQHNWEDSKCTICGKVCQHNWDDGECTICGKACEHTWDDGKCSVCGKTCEHTWDDGKCSVCGKTCEHNWVDSECTICGKVCQHTEYENGFCTGCDIFESAKYNEEDNVYEISNAGQLYWFADKVNNDNANFGSANVILTDNIVVNEGTMSAETVNARPWTPIGTSYDNGFIGTFDGNNKTVSGLYFNDTEASYVGLFGYVYHDGVVKNTGVINSYFNAYSKVAGVAGENWGGTISNCYNTSEVNGAYHYVAGLVAFNYYGLITDSYNTGTVIGKSAYVGGVVGYNMYSEVERCYNAGATTGNLEAGGIVGYNFGSPVTNCYNTGAVSGSSNSGGIVGYHYKSTVTNCYSIGKISVTSDNGSINSICAAVEGDSVVSNCYYLEGNAPDANSTAKSSDAFASGEVAYLLQGQQAEKIWGQKIGTDDYPALGGDKVYVKTDAEGNAVYYNKTAEENTDKLEGYTISLGDKVAVNYYMSLTEETLKDANAKMIFTVPDTGSTYTVEIPVSEAVKSGDDYVFTCEVAAKEMTSAISAKLVTSETELQLDDYSVQKYAEVILSDTVKYAKEQELVKNMLNYGAAAQLYFNFNTDNLANDTELMTKEEKTVESFDFSGASYALEGEEAGVTYYGTALSLKSELAFKHYFIVEDGVDVKALDIKCSYPVELRKSGTLYELKISGIPAHMMGEDISVTMGGMTLTYSIYSYGAMAQSSGDTALYNVMSALVVYATEAGSYAVK